MVGKGAFENGGARLDPRSTCSITEITDTGTCGFILADENPPAFVEAQSRYQIIEELGNGGTGRVYRARDLDLKRDVALKILLAHLVDNPRVAEQFTEEARIIGSLQHPGIAQVYECGTTDDDRPFHTMKLVEGSTMRAVLRERRGDRNRMNRLLQLFAQVCQTLDYTHTQGVIHLDLKPTNIMVGVFGEVHVMDWGLAHSLKDHSQNVLGSKASNVNSTPMGRVRLRGVRGSLEYMAPEQANVEYLDRRTDVFGLGAILCEILTGLPPYLGDSREEILAAARSGRLDRAMQRLSECDCPAVLSRLAQSCLQPNPADRPQSAKVLAEEMNLYLDSRQKRAENDMTRFFELSLDLFCIAGFDGYFRRVNQNFSIVLGYSEQELFSTPFIEWVIEEDREDTKRVMEKLAMGLPVIKFQNRYRSKSGEIVRFEWTAKSLPNERQVFAVARKVGSRPTD